MVSVPDQPAVYNQPVGTGFNPQGGPSWQTYVPGVTLRLLQDNDSDAQFAAELTVEAFKEKFAHNVTERKLPICVKNMAANYKKQPLSFYQRTYVAELNGRPAGIIQIKFKGDKENGSDEGISELGCWHACRYICMNVVLDEDVKAGKCYVSHICVSDWARGKGVGKALMERAESDGRTRSCRCMYLAVTTSNRARNLYERQGYHVTSTETCCCCLHCCIGPPGAVYIMEKPLV